MAYRDSDALDDIATRLEATGAFDAVLRHTEEARESRASDATAIAFVEPWSWREVDRNTNDDGAEAVREVAWRLTLEIRDPDPRRRDTRLDRLAAVAAAALNGVGYGDFCLPAFSRLRAGQYLPHTPAARQIRIAGEFSYLVDDDEPAQPEGNGPDTTDDINYLG